MGMNLDERDVTRDGAPSIPRQVAWRVVRRYCSARVAGAQPDDETVAAEVGQLGAREKMLKKPSPRVY